MTSVIAGMKSFGIIPTEFIGSVVERGSGAKYNPKLTNLQCLRKQNLGLSTQGKTIINALLSNVIIRTVKFSKVKH